MLKHIIAVIGAAAVLWAQEAVGQALVYKTSPRSDGIEKRSLDPVPHVPCLFGCPRAKPPKEHPSIDWAQSSVAGISRGNDPKWIKLDNLRNCRSLHAIKQIEEELSC